MTELVTCGDNNGLITVFHQGAQMISVLVGSAAIMLILFNERIVALWTGNPSLALRIAPLLTLLALGTLLNCLMHITYMLQLAYAWITLGIKCNIVSVAVLIPAILWVTPRYGVIGAAWIWVALNMGYVFIAVHLVHRRLLPDEKWRWYWQDVGLPLGACLIFAGLGRLLMIDKMSQFMTIVYLTVVSILTLMFSAISTPTIRGWLFKKLLNLKLAFRN